MEIRRAVADDASAICEMEERYFSDSWDKKDVFSYICSEGGMCFVALENGRVIAYVIGRMIAPEGEIYRVAVDEKYRQRGIGYRLLSFMLKTERGRGLETVFLEVRRNNAAAIALYRAHGFKDAGIRKNYYQNPTDDALIMLYGNCQY
ncbi:MAG: ribosomal protein S18-alanine N-acetyltransferase [Clostridia bacterium]|nr:ribosomal protein S18-alanine N-acetyltransferase [Clostridia bacterium]